MNKVNISGFDQLPDEAVTSVKVIAAVMGNGVSTVWRYAALNPDFPKPIRLSARCTRFRVGDSRIPQKPGDVIMRKPQVKIAPIEGQGESKKPRSHSNAAHAQRQRLLDALRKGMVSTLDARRDLDILAPAARVHELRHRFGHQIDLVWVQQQTECGKLHRVGMYVLRPTGESRND